MKASAAVVDCPLCAGVRCYRLEADGYGYWRCRDCDLIHLDPCHRLDAAAEKAVYDLHRNDIHDPGYRRFLSRSADQVLARVRLPATGLDFGCGPGPALVAMLRERGYMMRAYDPVYRDDPSVLEAGYDFITCTEVAEHFHRPRESFERLRALLRPGGLLVVQTRFAVADAAFTDWSYRRDPTHVVFYACSSFQWLARAWSARAEIHGHDVVSLVTGVHG